MVNVPCQIAFDVFLVLLCAAGISLRVYLRFFREQHGGRFGRGISDFRQLPLPVKLNDLFVLLAFLSAAAGFILDSIIMYRKLVDTDPGVREDKIITEEAAKLQRVRISILYIYFEPVHWR